MARRDRRLLIAFSSRPPRGAEIGSDISSIGGQTTIFGVTDSRRDLLFGVLCCSASFTGRSPTNFSLVKKLIPSLFFIGSTNSLPLVFKHKDTLSKLVVIANDNRCYYLKLFRISSLVVGLGAYRSLHEGEWRTVGD